MLMNHDPQPSRDAFISRVLLATVLLLALYANEGTAQGRESAFYEQSLRINNHGMAVLGTWALANIAIGAYGWVQYSGERKYFHQMNLFWNSVNLSIAVFALYTNLTQEYSLMASEELLSKQLKSQRLFLINAGLDVMYMGSGLFLKRISSRYPETEVRLNGYGNSVILQGAFLFVFDLVMFGLQHAHRAHFYEGIALKPLQDALGVALTYSF